MIMNPDPKIIAQCDTPYEFRLFTISFRYFTPMPGALEFHPGKDYYFISTSSKGDLHRRIHGMCLTNNMKVVFKVAPTQQPGDKTPSSPVLTTARPAVSTQDSLPNRVSTTGDLLETKEKDRKKKKNRKNKRKHKRKKNQRREDNEISLDSEQYKPPSAPKIVEHTPSLVAKVNDLMKQQASIGASSHSSHAEGLHIHPIAFALIFICLILTGQWIRYRWSKNHSLHQSVTCLTNILHSSCTYSSR